jgi:hypothetical protein
VPEIGGRSERTSTPVSNRAIPHLGNCKGNFTESRYRATQNVFELLGDTIENLVNTPDNWNSYGSPPPSRTAVQNAQPILKALRAKLLEPERVLPSAEGGVAFTFVSDTISRAAIESLNDGGAFVLLYDLKGNAETIEWPNTLDAQLNVVGQIAAHLRSNGVAPEGH